MIFQKNITFNNINSKIENLIELSSEIIIPFYGIGLLVFS